MEPCRYERQGSRCSATIRQVNQTELVLTCHETTDVVQSPACDDAWRWFMAKRFCGNGLALVASARRFSSSVRTAIAGIAIAALSAVTELAAGSGSSPTGATNGAARAGSIIAIGNGSTGAASVKRDRA